MSEGRLAALRREISEPSEAAPAGRTDGLATAARLAEIDQQSLPPITAEQVDKLGRVMLWRVLVEPVIPKQPGLIVFDERINQAERILSQIGRVLAIGSQCFKSTTPAGVRLFDEPHLPKIGDVVLHEAYAGTEVKLASGHNLRLLTDTECLMVISDPDLVRGYV